ncbi:WecB/TagA/CpsF family glycosyltransferase [Marinobacter sp.]|uniref:WecB/TagA/CpsF family glycosyltransferase n=1 Tax=Marinobacter sp. TaxID=50741 RepID=UPI000C5F45BA|nr:WecB/TagA/CpsF family glycosyltransferase [Marinobacter sp.]MAO13075.1 glycosyl transferase [Marinobacter sp.]|tara:strand:- start:826 stop:1524 length:699 start_codon:yes stop_codon:yes gene_type:complete
MDSDKLNGVRVFAPTSRQALIEYAFQNRSLLVAVNAEKLLHATDQTRSIINRNVGYPDGLGAVMGLKKKGLRDVVKIPGCELWLDIIRSHYREKSFYLVGGKESVIGQAVAQLKAEFPGIRILGHRNGYLNGEEDKQALIADITAKKPDVVFVAMGSPRQELLMEEMQGRHPAVYQGLGGSFDVYTGQVHRAPSWWVEHHLEWLYRLLQEPTRIKRQIHLVRFLMRVALNRL